MTTKAKDILKIRKKGGQGIKALLIHQDCYKWNELREHSSKHCKPPKKEFKVYLMYTMRLLMYLTDLGLPLLVMIR